MCENVLDFMLEKFETKAFAAKVFFSSSKAFRFSSTSLSFRRPEEMADRKFRTLGSQHGASFAALLLLHFAHLGFLFPRLVFQTCDGFLLLGIKRTWFELGPEVPFVLGDEGSFCY